MCVWIRSRGGGTAKSGLPHSYCCSACFVFLPRACAVPGVGGVGSGELAPVGGVCGVGLRCQRPDNDRRGPTHSRILDRASNRSKFEMDCSSSSANIWFEVLFVCIAKMLFPPVKPSMFPRVARKEKQASQSSGTVVLPGTPVKRDELPDNHSQEVIDLSDSRSANQSLEELCSAEIESHPGDSSSAPKLSSAAPKPSKASTSWKDLPDAPPLKKRRAPAWKSKRKTEDEPDFISE